MRVFPVAIGYRHHMINLARGPVEQNYVLVVDAKFALQLGRKLVKFTSSVSWGADRMVSTVTCSRWMLDFVDTMTFHRGGARALDPDRLYRPDSMALYCDMFVAMVHHVKRIPLSALSKCSIHRSSESWILGPLMR